MVQEMVDSFVRPLACEAGRVEHSHDPPQYPRVRKWLSGAGPFRPRFRRLHLGLYSNKAPGGVFGTWGGRAQPPIAISEPGGIVVGRGCARPALLHRPEGEQRSPPSPGPSIRKPLRRLSKPSRAMP